MDCTIERPCPACLMALTMPVEQQQAARLANLPGLTGWIPGKWTIDGTYIYGEDATYGRIMFAHCADYDTAKSMFALLNACYPPAPDDPTNTPCKSCHGTLPGHESDKWYPCCCQPSALGQEVGK